MNRKALLGKLIFLAVVLIFFMGAVVYFTFKDVAFQFRTGKVTINVDYNSSLNDSNGTEIEIIDVTPKGFDTIDNNNTNVTEQMVSGSGSAGSGGSGSGGGGGDSGSDPQESGGEEESVERASTSASISLSITVAEE